ncbi:hypothetical protein [Paenibacillus sp. KN14-4R]|uniref:hypothetical protein n=1 Tax=Paenibacillus sp. KN14-4R TaxID=3445773 RepID=UPI003FA0AEF1
MDSNLKSMLWLSFATVIFISALTVALYQVHFIGKTVQTTYISGNELDHNIVNTSTNLDVFTVSSAVVLQSIYHIEEIKVNIQVNGHLYPKDLKIEQADLSFINQGKKYVRKSVRGSQGELIRIDYEST